MDPYRQQKEADVLAYFTEYPFHPVPSSRCVDPEPSENPRKGPALFPPDFPNNPCFCQQEVEPDPRTHRAWLMSNGITLCADQSFTDYAGWAPADLIGGLERDSHEPSNAASHKPPCSLHSH
jgi:hypothetical protein